MNGSPDPAPADEPITPDLLADLQAGLLDDAAAARLRHRVRSEPEAAAQLAALERVRRDLARFGADTSSAPPLPPESAARIATTLRHLERRPRHRRLRTAGLIAGAGAAVLAVGLGTAMLVRTPGPASSTRATIEELTQAPDIGLSDTQLLSLLSQQPELGAFDDPRRRADCLSNLGYPPGVKVLGGRSLEVNGRPGVLILLPDGAPGSIVGLVVTTDCTAEDAGLLAHTVVKRP